MELERGTDPPPLDLMLEIALLVLGSGVAAIVVYLAMIGFVLDLSVPLEPLPSGAGGPGPAETPIPKTDVSFDVDGTPVRAWLFLPDRPTGPVGCIVLGHGFGGTKNAGLDRYAARFREAGWAALAFDYRHFGESGGEPRQLYSIPRQLEDWAAAVAFARSVDGVDPARIALWGSSASGGHVVVTAANDARIACVCAQCPALDPRTDARALRERLGLRGLLRLVVHAQRDLVRSRFGQSPHRIPIVARPGKLALLDAPGAFEGYAALAPEGFVNAVCARVTLRAGGYRPIEHAARVRCPVLIQVCELDNLASPESAEATAERLGALAQLERYPVGHFDIYRGAHFEAAVQDQLAFLHKHLQGGAS